MTYATQRDARRQTPDAKGLRPGERARHRAQGEEAERLLDRFACFRQAPGEAREHSLHMLQLSYYRRNCRFVGHAQEGRDEQVRLQLRSRTQCDVHKSAKLSISEPATSFGDIRSDRHRRPPTLRNKPKSLRCRKLLCDPVDAMDNNTTYLPNLEFPKVLHRPLVQDQRPRRNVPDDPTASGVWVPESGAPSSYLTATLSTKSSTSGVWRLASGVSHPTATANLS